MRPREVDRNRLSEGPPDRRSDKNGEGGDGENQYPRSTSDDHAAGLSRPYMEVWAGRRLPEKGQAPCSASARQCRISEERPPAEIRGDTEEDLDRLGDRCSGGLH